MSKKCSFNQNDWIQTSRVPRLWNKDVSRYSHHHGNLSDKSECSTKAKYASDPAKVWQADGHQVLKPCVYKHDSVDGGNLSEYSREGENEHHSPPFTSYGSPTKSNRELSSSSLEARKEKRDLRHRPWTESSRQKPAISKVGTSETHYEACLPKDQWMNLRPMKYVRNPKWGQAYQIRKHPSTKKPFKPQTEEWLIENDFRIWLFEKTKSAKLELAFAPNGPFVTNVKNVHGRRQVDRIGAHRDLYEQYHSERLQKDKEQKAAVLMQKHVRGWLVRNRIKKLQQEVSLFHGTSWNSFTKYYKALMSRIQRRNGIEKPKTGFDLDQVETFLQKKSKYEKLFYEIAAGEKIPRDQLQSFFNACNLQPREADVEEAFKSVFKGCSSQAEVVIMLDCSSGLTFPQTKLQQEFVKELLGEVRPSKTGVRVAIVPFNSKSVEACGLGDFNSKEEILQAMEEMECQPGSFQCGSALHHVTHLLNSTSRPGAPQHCIVVTNGKAKVTKTAEREARLAREKGLTMIVVGVGETSENKQLLTLASSPDHVFPLTDLYVLEDRKQEVTAKLCLNNCVYCRSMCKEEDPFHYQVYDTASKKIVDVKIQGDSSEAPVASKENRRHNFGRGLKKHELMEVLWTLYPPQSTGLPQRHTSTWIRPVVDGQEFAEVGGDTEAEFEKCLELVLKSKLDREGKIIMPVGEENVEEVTDYDTALKYAKQYLADRQPGTLAHKYGSLNLGMQEKNIHKT